MILLLLKVTLVQYRAVVYISALHQEVLKRLLFRLPESSGWFPRFRCLSVPLRVVL